MTVVTPTYTALFGVVNTHQNKWTSVVGRFRSVREGYWNDACAESDFDNVGGRLIDFSERI